MNIKNNLILALDVTNKDKAIERSKPLYQYNKNRISIDIS